jgi:hypothetical protein
VWGVAFRTGTEFSVDGGPEVLKGTKEVNETILKKDRVRRKNFESKQSPFLGVNYG